MSSSEQESELSNDEVSEEESDQSEQGNEESESEEEPIVAKVVEKKRKDSSRKKKKSKDPNKPKRNMSAYFLYSNANRARIQQENPDAKFGDIAKLISAEFKALGDKEKKKWDKKAARDKERYLDEMSRYEPPDSDSDDSDTGKKKKKRKQAKDPNKPKRNMSAYFLFSCANRADIKSENPDASFGDIAKLVSQKFKSLSDKERKKWDKKAAKDKIRYDEEMKAYLEEN